ncbi:MAG: hypothetical protein J07HN6_00371, partial [Halonotius sp. J07HN6]
NYPSFHQLSTVTIIYIHFMTINRDSEHKHTV